MREMYNRFAMLEEPNISNILVHSLYKMVKYIEKYIETWSLKIDMEEREKKKQRWGEEQEEKFTTDLLPWRKWNISHAIVGLLKEKKKKRKKILQA